MISIITPTYNREILLQTTIRSIQAQTYTDWELIIVDDGSTDNTEQAVQPFLRDARIRYIKKVNSGQAHSLNVGSDYAKGTFITFLDSDDEAYPEWLNVVNSHIKEDTGIVCVGSIRKLLDGRMIKEGLTESNIFGKKLKLKFTSGSLFIRRSVFNELGGYDCEFKANIQTDLGYRLMPHIIKSYLQVVSIDQYLMQINIHDGPRIRTDWNKVKEGAKQLFNKHFDFFCNYDRNSLSSTCTVIAFSSYKLKNRREAMYYIIKAIRYNPLLLRNYLRVLKYTFL